ncbi:hypothetical protein DL96DRAFT_1814695 [Flagelloscypha sp. PMI_526]|nr:hypothetical protein DL96DRAFT_1814695 [Flagelloscypha sp. PMI_526]
MRQRNQDLSLVTSWAFSPIALASFRSLFGIYGLLTLILNLAGQIRNGGAESFLSYLSCLQLIGLTSYLTSSAVQSWFYVLKETCPLTSSWPLLLLRLHYVLLATVLVIPFVVTVTYWTILVTPEKLDNTEKVWKNVSVHVCNSVYVVFEIFLTNIPPPPWLHLFAPLACLSMYLGVAYITHATQGFYTYPFLDPTHPKKLAIFIPCIGAATIIAFIFVKYIITYRRHLVRGSSREWGGDLPVDNGQNARELNDVEALRT